MTARHALSQVDFDAIAEGVGDAALIRLLLKVRLSRNLLLLAKIARQHPELEDAVELLSEAQSHSPAAAGTVIGYPWVSAWAAQCAAGHTNDASYLRAVAAAAALRAGLHSSGCGDMAYLPTIGLATYGQKGSLRISNGPRPVSVRHRGYELNLLLDDRDPYRDSHGHAVAVGLSDVEAATWTSAIDAAWRHLAAYATDRCAELAIGMTSVVPLSNEVRKDSSITHGDAFGALACTAPGDPFQFAAVLVHEFQHSKLNALMGLRPLHDPADRTLHTVPWRRDPRPIGGVLHGLYAFTAVAELWKAFLVHPAAEPMAQSQYSGVRRNLVTALETLDSPAGLSPAGFRFLELIRLRIQRL